MKRFWEKVSPRRWYAGKTAGVIWGN